MTLAKGRELEALELRKAGATYDQIATRIGITREGSRRAVKRALAALSAECTEVAEEIRSLELERLDAMLLGVWDKARKGDLLAIDRVLKIQERRARFLGIDQPVRIASSHDEDPKTTINFVRDGKARDGHRPADEGAVADEDA
jgi:NTP pyrophosphatase (non-canonical NTP hydrolase)